MIGRSLDAPQRCNHGDQRLPVSIYLFVCLSAEAVGDSFMQPVSWPEFIPRCKRWALIFSSHNGFHLLVVSGSNGITVRLSQQSLASALVKPAVFGCAPILIVTVNLLNRPPSLLFSPISLLLENFYSKVARQHQIMYKSFQMSLM